MANRGSRHIRQITDIPEAGLVGRSAELATLENAVAETVGGTARTLFIEGEGGIGKSTLLAAVTRRAADLGFAVLGGRAEELERDRPFRAISEAIGGLGPHGRSRRDEITRMLASEPGGEGLFFRLIDAFEDAVEAAALASPVLLAIDDLHWADPGTVRSLESISRRLAALPIAVVGAMRTVPRNEDLAAFLRAAAPVATTVVLGPLGESDVTQLARARVGARPGPKLRAHLERAGGNPFYVTELLDSLQAASLIDVANAVAEIGGSELPPSLVTTLLNRLSAIPAPAAEMLRTAAVLGTRFRVDHLAAAAGVAVQEAMAAVSELSAHGVLSGEDQVFRFRHDLIREAVYGDLGEPRQTTMHGQVARALSEAGAPPSVVAAHLVRGAPPGDTAAAETLIRAATETAVDTRTAAMLLQGALDICPRDPMALSLVPWLARLLLWQGRAGDAIAHLRRALTEASHGTSRMSVLLTLSAACRNSGRPEEARAWWLRAEELAEELALTEDPRALLLAGQALFGTRELFERSLALTERAAALVAGSDERLEAEAHNQACWLLLLLLRAPEALAHSERALELPATPATKVLYWRHHAYALADLDRVEDAEAAMGVAITLAEEEGLVWVLHGLLVELAMLRYATGRWDEALNDVETALAIAAEHGDPESFHPTGIDRSIRFHRLEDLGATPEGSAPRNFFTASLDAIAAEASGDRDTAGALAREWVEAIHTAPSWSRQRAFDVLPVLARIALAAGDAESARLAHDIAVGVAEGSTVPSICLAAERCRTVVYGDPEAARRASSLARSSPRKILAAGALEEAAAVLAGKESRDCLTDALHRYDELGAVRDQKRVGLELDPLPGGRTPERRTASRRAGWDALTPTELEVVRLAADGLTNREIGTRLFVSHRTVATHLSHVFEKLGLRSRVELARQAARRLR